MQKGKFLLFLIGALIIGYLGFQVFDKGNLADLIRTFILPLATIYFVIQKKVWKNYFFFFLFFYSISEFLGFFIYFENSFFTNSSYFYTGNLLYIAAYLVLIFSVLKTWNFKKILSGFVIHIILLLFLGTYCVYIISDLLIVNNILSDKLDLALVVAYNVTIMFFLMVMVINYISKQSKKAIILLLGALCVFFSEIIQFASFYITETIFMNILYFIFLVAAFYLFFVQYSMSNVESNKVI